MTPVDYLSQTIVYLASDPNHFNGAYNAVAGERIPAVEVFKQMQTKDLIDDVIPMRAWQGKLSDHAVRENDPSLKRVAESLSDLTLYLTDESVYDCSRFESAAQSQGLQRPPVDARYFDKLFSTMSA